jgi:hypothetical protein
MKLASKQSYENICKGLLKKIDVLEDKVAYGKLIFKSRNQAELERLYQELERRMGEMERAA